MKNHNSSSGGSSNNERNVRMWFALKVFREGRGGKERREVGCCKQSSRSWSVAKGNSWGCQKWKKLLRTEESREETTRLKGSFCEPCTPVCKSCLWCGLQHKNVFEQFILMILLGEDQRDIPTRNSLGKKKRQHENDLHLLVNLKDSPVRSICHAGECRRISKATPSPAFSGRIKGKV